MVLDWRSDKKQEAQERFIATSSCSLVNKTRKLMARQDNPDLCNTNEISCLACFLSNIRATADVLNSDTGISNCNLWYFYLDWLRELNHNP